MNFFGQKVVARKALLAMGSSDQEGTTGERVVAMKALLLTKSSYWEGTTADEE